VALQTAEISSVTIDSDYVTSYVNGSSHIHAAMTNIAPTLSGSYLSFIGHNANVSELIGFNRVLKDEERQSIEAYLGQKYGIRVATQ
jgi:hypothetical protein